MIPIKCIDCIHCLPRVDGWSYSYYPRNCGEGMTVNAHCFCPKTFPLFKDSSKKLVLDRSSNSVKVVQLSLFD